MKGHTSRLISSLFLTSYTVDGPRQDNRRKRNKFNLE